LGFRRNGTKDNEGITLDYGSFGGVRVFPRYLWIWGFSEGGRGRETASFPLSLRLQSFYIVRVPWMTPIEGQ